MTRRYPSIFAVFVTSVIIALIANPVSAQADPTGGADGARWREVHDTDMIYPEVNVQWDVPIRMSDGTILQANIYRPANADRTPVNVKMPVVLNMTPYTKLLSAIAGAAVANPILLPFAEQVISMVDLSGTPIDGVDDLAGAITSGQIRTFGADFNLVRSGYTQVVVDVRGTGFSQGSWDVMRQREQQDTLETIDWASKQEWSNGAVGMSGSSYSGINQIYAANKNPAALRAIFPVAPGGDLAHSIMLAGGALGTVIVPGLILGVNAAKMIPNVASMLNGTFDWKWLSDRIENPVPFVPLLIQALTQPSMTDMPPELAALYTADGPARQAYQDHADKITTPTFIFGGWFDLFAYDEVEMFQKIPLAGGKKQLLMGETYHFTVGAGRRNIGPGHPPRVEVLQRAWFDKWLKGIDNGIDEYGPATLYQQGNGWTTATDFPRPGSDYQRMYLSDQPSGTAPTALRDGSLQGALSGSNGRLTVAPGLTTLCSRDAAQQTAGAVAILAFCAKDSRIAESNALTFTSGPVTQATQISGAVNVRLNTVLDATDGYWAVTLNDVAPDGTSRQLTSGQVVASLRAYDPDRSKFAPNGDVVDPYTYLTLDKRLPLVPGQATGVDIGLLGTDALLEPGHRLRVDVYAMNFPKGLTLPSLLSESQLRPQHIQLDPANPSYMTLPSSVPLR
ncbi:CocE/NonD family hydrolase [Nocardia sp. NPDC051756]|uniref:CocE/NonD family hydrolase n=1 Tax=Nocardia sp. NPDC051756 TaxID=3154751 RepID=UPI00342072A5